MTKAQERYARRKKAGLCVWCGKPSRPGKVKCEECSRYAKETKAYYLGMGFCPVCRRYRVYGGEKECPECRARRIKNNRLVAEKALSEGKAWADPHRGCKRAQRRYRMLKEQGLCVKCGRRPHAADRTMCRICLDRTAERMRGYRERWEQEKAEGAVL